MIRLRPSGVDEILIKRVQDWYEPGPGVFITSTSTLFTPAQLFTGSTVGVWYDPSDTTTLFQDAAGTTPVTAVEQPVGLMLDKSKGLVLGSELVTNGDFATDTAWTKGTGWVIGGGTANADGSMAGASFLSQSMTLVAGKAYEVKLTVISNTSGRLRLNSSLFPITTLGVGSYKWVFTALTTTADFRIEARDAGTIASIDNISVRELPGNHAFQSTAGNRPTLSARYNLLTKTEDFSAADWTKDNTQIGAKGAAPNGANTADLLYPATTGLYRRVYQSATPNWNTSSKFSFSAKQAGFRYIGMFNTTGNGLGVTFDLQTGVTTTHASGITANMVAEANGYWRCSYASASGYASVYLCDAVGTGTATANGTSGIYIWGADLRVANDALNQPAYQRVNTSTDYDTTGFKPYLAFNGTSSSMATNSIDFSYGDKMFVCAGVRNIARDVLGYNVLTEISSSLSSNNGAFSVFAWHHNLSSTALFQTKGTSVSNAFTTNTSFSPPSTFVLTGIGNISGDQSILRMNGTQVDESTADQGTGNYGNYAMYWGARAGSSLWFNGRLYGAVVAGKQASAAEITSTETYINQKTGAF